MKRILLVDDDPSVLRSMQRVLRREFEVQVAANGAEALARFAEFRPDVVISNSSMPGMSGCELLAEVRRRDPKCEALLVSGSDATPPPGLELVLKPWEPQEMLRRLRGPAQAA